MKKIILSMAVIASTMLVACGNKADQAKDAAKQAADKVEGTLETLTVEEIDIAQIDPATAPTDAEAPSLIEKLKTATDPSQVKDYVTKGIAYVKNLVNTGKLAEAKAYLEQLKPYASKAGMDKIVESTSALIDKAEKATGVTGAVDKAKEAGAEAVDKAKDAGAKAVDKAKEVGSDAVDKVKEAGANALNKL